MSLIRESAVLYGLCSSAASMAVAQSPTGTIQGRVQSDAGAPIAEAQVYLVGTAFGAVTDPRGHYFINNVPAGLVTARAAFVGYRPLEIVNLRVLAGQAVTQDFTLESSPLQLQTLEVVGAENPLVPRDEVTTKQRVQGDFLEHLPIDRVNDVLVLQPGVVATRSRGPLALSIRGGRSDEVAVYLDGVPVTPGYRGLGFATPSAQISVGTNAVEEASVTTGSPSAEFGNAQSGVVSLVTRTGSSTHYSGSLSYQTDEPFGVNHSLGFNRIEASFGGPLVSHLRFFAAAVLEGQTSADTGRGSEQAPLFVPAGLDTVVAVPSDPFPTADTTYVPVYHFAAFRGGCDAFSRSANPGIRSNYGVRCQGIRMPYSPISTYELAGKLSYSYGAGSRVALSYLRSQTQQRPFDDATYSNLYNTQTLSGARDWSDVLTLTWTPNLTRSANRALALEVYLSYQQDRSLSGPLSRESELSTRSPFGGFLIRPLGFLFNYDNFPLDRELVENIRLNRPKTRRSPYDLDDPVQFNLIDQYRNDAYGLVGWTEGGGPAGRLRFYRENRYLAKANLDWQLDRYDRLKLGGEGTIFSISRYETELARLGDAYIEHPERWNVYVEDRLDLGDVVLLGGLRFDTYASRASRPFLLDTISTSDSLGKYVNLPDAPVYAAGGTFDGRPLVVQRPDRRHDYLSPHIQVSFPVSDRTNVRFSYAHQVQAPDFALVLDGVNVGGAGADLDFGKTIGVEFGARHAFNDDMVVDVAIYNRDNLALASARTFLVEDPVRQKRSSVVRVTNADFGNARGVDVRLDRRFGDWFNGTLGYTYQDAKSTAVDPFSVQDRGVAAIKELGGIVGPPPQAIVPTAVSRPHDLTAAVAFTVPPQWHKGTVFGSVFGNLGFFITARYASGVPYTPCREIGQGGSCRRASSVNSARLPATKQFDLRLTKAFDIGRLGITAYLDARNLFDFTNVLQVFSTTGTTVNQEDHKVRWSADSSSFAQDALATASSSGFAINQSDGSLDLRFNGQVASGCAVWKQASGRAAAPDCVYLIRAEERFGDGDHIFTLAEQRRASDAFYAVAQGPYNFTGNPRRLRLGIEVTF